MCEGEPLKADLPKPKKMAGIGTGYDLSASTYSPDGRIFQIEYANKAVENSGYHTLAHYRTCLGIKCVDGIVLAHEKLITSKLLVPGSNSRIQTIDRHIGFVGGSTLILGCSWIACRFKPFSGKSEGRSRELQVYIPPSYPCQGLILKIISDDR